MAQHHQGTAFISVPRRQKDQKSLNTADQKSITCAEGGWGNWQLTPTRPEASKRVAHHLAYPYREKLMVRLLVLIPQINRA